jgi:sigma-B regulation protein RsbQ
MAPASNAAPWDARFSVHATVGNRAQSSIFILPSQRNVVLPSYNKIERCRSPLSHPVHVYAMSIRFRNNIHVAGSGDATMIFVHGFGCDQTMWRFITPEFQQRFRIVCYDLVGSGDSDLESYDRNKYSSLHGHVQDLLEIIDTCSQGPVVVVGHSVGAMIGMLATIAAPHRFAAQIMVSPSPCFINDDDYIGGFNRDDMETLLATMEDNFLGWSLKMTPLITGGAEHPALSREVARRFCRNDAVIMRHFARVTFLSDHRADLPRSRVPALVLQCSDDLLVPHEVGPYMLRHLPGSTLRVIDNVGHCPHMSAPSASSMAIEAFLAQA